MDMDRSYHFSHPGALFWRRVTAHWKNQRDNLATVVDGSSCCTSLFRVSCWEAGSTASYGRARFPDGPSSFRAGGGRPSALYVLR